ncbi:LpxI family protein [Hyphococcus luteus]|uniref:DUF1009 domain-containing protein n=1 Tax=Hyphococcus luteus TaxID=2058213 RepID=A0A2S7JYR0_9PROT|nr:UDP-2,3-diacylglucosamine diphosphatase LpxI [Marinicaulis flavus]PQA85382.1 DUF1009 domain-containing protein [Marinicaulis flavus]
MTRWRKLGVIAGGGALPLRIAEACAAAGKECFFIRLAGVAEPGLGGYPGEDCAIGEAGKIIRMLKQEGCDAAVYAGIVKRPDFANLKADWRGAALLPKIIKAAGKGDGAILNVLVETLEAEGLLVIGPDEVVEDVACEAGPVGRLAPAKEQFADICKAAAIVQALGPFDVGQGAVVANGFVLAIEAAEGTDAMLDRCAALANDASRGGVLVKRPKPGQELRIDLPVIGAETIRRAARARLAGVAVEAKHCIIIDRREVAQLADEAGLFVYGFTQQDLEGEA